MAATFRPVPQQSASEGLLLRAIPMPAARPPPPIGTMNTLKIRDFALAVRGQPFPSGDYHRVIESVNECVAFFLLKLRRALEVHRRIHRRSTTSAPNRSVPSTFAIGADSGITIVAWTLLCWAAKARPCA